MVVFGMATPADGVVVQSRIKVTGTTSERPTESEISAWQPH